MVGSGTRGEGVEGGGGGDACEVSSWVHEGEGELVSFKEKTHFAVCTLLNRVGGFPVKGKAHPLLDEVQTKGTSPTRVVAAFLIASQVLHAVVLGNVDRRANIVDGSMHLPVLLHERV